MKKQHMIILAFVAIVTATAAAESEKHLFILSGQSNMARLDPNTSFIPDVEKKFGAENIIVIKDAEGGIPIRRWYKDWEPATGEAPTRNVYFYTRLMKKVNAAIQGETIQTVTFIWMQGERDAREGHGEVYKTSLIGLRDQLANDLNREDVFFVIGRLSDCGTLKKEEFPHWTMIRKIQMDVADADPLATWVDTDDLNGEIDDLHYTRDGYELLGKRFAEAAIGLIGKNDSE